MSAEQTNILCYGTKHPLFNSPGLPPSSRPQVGKKTRWLLYGFGMLAAFVLLVAATVTITLWWIQRPIKPVVLSAAEKAAVEEKLQSLGGGSAPQSETKKAAPNRGAGLTAEVPEAPSANAAQHVEADRPYVPGSKVLKLTEREINGLLNANTDLGDSVRIEFGRNAINAYLVVPIPKDFPIAGGKMFRARGRFLLSLREGGAPYAVLEDVTVFGLSLPKAWLGGLKGENLIGEAMGERKGSPVLRGIKSLQVEPGALVLEVQD